MFGNVAMKKEVISHIDSKILNQLLAETENKVQFIDVRSPEEFYGRHIKGFTNIPLQNLESRKAELDKDIPLVIICASGARSMSAANFLKSDGFKQILNVNGGISYYRA